MIDVITAGLKNGQLEPVIKRNRFHGSVLFQPKVVLNDGPYLLIKNGLGSAVATVCKGIGRSGRRLVRTTGKP